MIAQTLQAGLSPPYDQGYNAGLADATDLVATLAMEGADTGVLAPFIEKLGAGIAALQRPEPKFTPGVDPE